MTTQSKSLLCIRSAMPSIASSIGTPRRASTSARLNSPVMGCWPSRTTVSIACGIEYPADRLPETSWRVSGSWVRKAEVRRDSLAIR